MRNTYRTIYHNQTGQFWGGDIEEGISLEKYNMLPERLLNEVHQIYKGHKKGKSVGCGVEYRSSQNLKSQMNEFGKIY